MQPPATAAQKTWTVLSLMEWSTAHLTERNFDEARLHVELLLAHVLHYSRLQLYTNFDRPLTSDELGSFKEFFKRRLTHEPLQYILGETDFMGMHFTVNKSVLIPRPETELLVEKAVALIQLSTAPTVDVLDIGTGSGNIPVAIARLATNARVTSIDVSEEALEVARLNAETNNVSTVTFMRADVFSDILPDMMFDVIVSNPPYVSTDEFTTLQAEVRDFEPRLATTDDADGLKFIRRISQIAAQKLRTGGALFMEIGYNQSDAVKSIAGQAGLKNVEIFVDYGGHPRILSARN